MNIPARKHLSAFSLVEILVSLGIIVFVLVALMGLLSSGLRVSTQARTELEASQVAASLISRRRAAPTVSLPDFPIDPLTNATASLEHRYLDRSGTPVATASDAYYDLYYEVAPAEGNRMARLYLALAHPPQSQSTGYSAISQAEENFEITTYVRLP
ncbi:MAG TPA: hypothetical protein PLS03_03950 [Terrimicrobiaceae bacterium]|nr:hypothetical protein [Terrimicrobiaceae bacterium]